MPTWILQLDRVLMSKLKAFLLVEFRKRREDEVFFSVREWAREIGINNATLNRYMNKNGDVNITAKNMQALVDYFGLHEVLDALEIKVPKKPRNPKHQE